MQEPTFPPLLPTFSSDKCPESPHSLESLDNSDSYAPSSNCSDLDVPITNRKGVRSCTQHPISNHVFYSNLSSSYKPFLSKVSFVSLPTNFYDGLSILEWKHAMMEEMRVLSKNDTWELVELPRGKNSVGCKWVYTVKYKADGSIERYKVRLIAKGSTQTYGVHYQETFAPVAKMNSVRLLLSLTANLDWPLHQFDVKNAFLHRDLAEEVYMDIPPGFANAKSKGQVCRL
ncbi:hypothetical protein CsSME_00042657 [Camellia sinensis var. sinensis]